MDRIVKSLVEDLLAMQEIPSESPEKDFERFANYSIICNEFNKSFDIQDTLTGSGDDTAIDGIAILANGQLIETKEDIDFLIENNGYLEVTYIFIQSKTSPKFEGSEINNFSFGVKDFFAETPKWRRNIEIQNFVEISEHILMLASHFKENPKIKLLYVTNGTWLHDTNSIGIMEITKLELKATGLFSTVDFVPLGANDISKLYRDSKNKVTTTFIFQEKVTLPDLPGLTESYFGILPISEFKKILIDENNNLRNVFYDNVRDFQGISNPVNRHIAETLESSKPELFTVLNNGVTIVATSLKTSGNKFTVSDYQIVNGCQTSYVLFNHIKSEKLDYLSIPLKLVITDDDDIKNKITIATNSQTAVKREQLQAMTDFQKNLEHYYKTIEGDGSLYYERRSGQYQSDISVVKARIINIQNQIKSFSSIFNEDPDRVTTYFGSIIKQNVETDNPSIFNPHHKYLIYYTAGLAFYRLDTLFRTRGIDTQYRKVKFFMLMLFRMLIQPQPLPRAFMNSEKKVVEYCDPILKVLNNKEKALQHFEKVIDIIQFSGLNINDKQLIKQVNFTTKLKEAFGSFKR